MQQCPGYTVRKLPLLIWFLLSMAFSSHCHADIALSFIPIEESKYLIKGEGVQGISSASLTVNYDTTYLSAPELTAMGVRLEGAGIASSTPGNLQVQIVNEDRADNFEICLFFQKSGDYPAVINFVTADIVDLSGGRKPVPVEMAPSPNTPPAEDIHPRTPAASDPVDQSSFVAAENPSQEREFPTQDEHIQEADSPLQKNQRKAVFERFREFKGTKGLAALTSLFTDIGTGFRQIPAVVIADGRQTARVVFSGLKAGESAPHFAVSGGKLVSIGRGEQEEWVLVVVPQENEWDVRITCISAGETLEVPLTVVPPISIAPDALAAINESGFLKRMQLFVAENRHQQNQERPVWLQEYLFTANYLAARGPRSDAEVGQKRQKTAEIGRERRRQDRSR